MKSNYKRIGDYIRVVDERNTDLRVENLLGLSITKEFVPSVANTVGTDMSKYKIVKKNQFVCSTMQVRRDKKMPVALLQHVDEGIISPAYYVFEIIDEDVLLPEYLMMWFSREEFDREACFYAIGGVRGSLEWEDFCNMKLPIPSIEKQRKIVKEYNSILSRVCLNNSLVIKIEEIAQILYREWFVEGNFHNAVEGESIDFESGVIPDGWKITTLEEITDIKNGKSSKNKEDKDNKFIYPIVGASGIIGYSDEYLIDGKTLIIGRVGTLGIVQRFDGKIWPSDNSLYIKTDYYEYVNQLLKNINYNDITRGSTQPLITQSDIKNTKIILPELCVLKKFEEVISSIMKLREFYIAESELLQKFKCVLLSNMISSV